MPGRLARRHHGLAALLSWTFVALLAWSTAGEAAYVDGQLQRLKLLQRQIVLREPAEKLEHLERAHKRKARRSRAGARLRRPPAGAGDLGPPTAASLRRPAEPTMHFGAATSANVAVNDSTGEPGGATQSEVSIASYGDQAVAAWNDGIGIYNVPETDTQGFAYSTDGGLTWTDGGAPPNTNVGKWDSDPVVVVNEKTGAFYFAALCDPSSTENGIGVVKGTFSGGTFSWGTPTLAVVVNNATTLLDKSWMAVDSLSGNLYLTYASFGVVNGQTVSDQIRIVRSTDDGQTWIGTQGLSSPADDGLVQGARPAVGPDGEVYVVWHAVGQASGPNRNSPFGRDFLRVRKSTDGGVTFGPEVTADSLFSNFGSGAPGFNRGMGITFPGIAVDRSNGAHRGRVYLIWNESLNFYNDPFANPEVDAALARSEQEPDDAPLNATPFTPGEVLRGAISFRGDWDYWKFDGTQGQTVILYLDSLSTSLDAAFRMFCSDGSTLLGFSQNGTGGQETLVFTLPNTDTYWVRVASFNLTPRGVHGYRILTTLDTPESGRARDHRDIFVKGSDDGATWGPTVRVNDSPGRFDDWLPEVSVDGSGRVFEAHYDFRDGTSVCGALSNVYLGRSEDGGATWIPEIQISDASTNWTSVFSTLIPNQGDYIALFASDSTVFTGWGDGRVTKGPDVYATVATYTCASTPVSLVEARATKDTITVIWSAPAGFPATLQKRIHTGAYFDVGPVSANPGGRIVFEDLTVVAGETYSYRLGQSGYCQPFAGEATVRACVSAGVAFVDAQVDTHSVGITWSGPADLPATVYRRVAAGPYMALANITADAGGQIFYQDGNLVAGQSYSYRLGLQGFCEDYVGQVTVRALGTLVYEFALGKPIPNPTTHDVNVFFTLATGEPATLALYDVGGREVVRREVGALGPGLHSVNLTRDASVRAGIYFLRLSQGGRVKVGRVAIVP
jgi:pre-peptidase